MCDTLPEECDLQLLKTHPTGDLFFRNHCRNVSGIIKYLRSFFFNFMFYLVAWPGILREIISFTLQDCNADMNLLSAWSRKLLTQTPKMPFINLTEELKAQLHKYRDNR